MKIKLEPIDVTAIKSQVDKVAINSSPANNMEIVSNEELDKEVKPDCIKLSPLKILKANRQAAMHQILERLEINKVVKSSLGMHKNVSV